MTTVPLGRYPTPVFQSKPLSTAHGELWIKNDGVTDPLYGGNKVRKLAAILLQARSQGAKRLLTVGAAGSHHVLATTVHGRRHGFDVAAVLLPHPWSQHAENNLRAALGQGLEPIAVRAPSWAVPALVRARRRSDFVIAPGGLGLGGARAYWAAAQELGRQIAEGQLPEPDSLVVAVGTGTTAAGLLAGIGELGLRTRVIGVSVTPNPAAGALVRALAQAVRSTSGRRYAAARLRSRLEMDFGPGRAGYGVATPESEKALAIGRRVGLVVENTYTAKALARALAEVGHPAIPPRREKKVRLIGPKRILYWHTLSQVPLDHLLENAPEARDLNPSLRALFLRGK